MSTYTYNQTYVCVYTCVSIYIYMYKHTRVDVYMLPVCAGKQANRVYIQNRESTTTGTLHVHT